MTDDLDTLRPEVREALEVIEGEAVCTCHEAYTSRGMKDPGCNHDLKEYTDTLSAELLRLARENDEWQTRCLQFQTERDKARAELAALKARIQWQPISTAPTDGTCILVLDADGDVRHAHWDNPGWWCGYDCYGNDAFVEDPTMWMPLPPPPKGED